jgi:hypothetical protein
MASLKKARGEWTNVRPRRADPAQRDGNGRDSPRPSLPRLLNTLCAGAWQSEVLLATVSLAPSSSDQSEEGALRLVRMSDGEEQDGKVHAMVRAGQPNPVRGLRFVGGAWANLASASPLCKLQGAIKAGHPHPVLLDPADGGAAPEGADGRKAVRLVQHRLQDPTPETVLHSSLFQAGRGQAEEAAPNWNSGSPSDIPPPGLCARPRDLRALPRPRRPYAQASAQDGSHDRSHRGLGEGRFAFHRQRSVGPPVVQQLEGSQASAMQTGGRGTPPPPLPTPSTRPGGGGYLTPSRRSFSVCHLRDGSSIEGPCGTAVRSGAPAPKIWLPRRVL